MSITMTELARRLNLSQSTVSLVLNNRDKNRVRPELAEKIRQAAQETGFRPNRAAADLRRRCSNTIGVAIAYSNNLHRMELVNELHSEIVRRHYRPLFAFFSTDEEQRTATELLLSSSLDAIITLEPKLLPDKLNLPVVSFSHEDPRFDALLFDFETGILQTFEHLKSLGHHRFGWIGFGFTDPRTRLLAEMAPAAGVEFIPEVTLYLNPPYSPMAQTGALNWWRDLPKSSLPTAIICHNDTIALYTIRRLQEAGFRVPEDFSIIGLDNIHFCTQITPTLTSIGYENSGIIAQKLVDLVFRRMEKPNAPRHVEYLSPKLFARESTIPVCRTGN